MNVLHIIGSMDPTSGGPCQGIRNSMRSFGNRLTHREVVSLDEPTAAFLGLDDFPIHALGRGKSPWQYNGKLCSWLMENLGRFDVVVINGLWLYTSYAVHKTVKRFRKQQAKKASPGEVPRVFVMPHGMLDPYFQKAPERRWKALRNWLYWKLIEGKVVNDADGVLFTCETEMVLARKPFRPYQPKREINIGYGIKPPPPFTELMQQAFVEKCPGLNGESFLLFISRIHSKKGVENLIDAYASLLKERGERPLPKLVIAGPGLETRYGRKMLSLVEKAQLTSRVIFPGMLSGDAKWGAFYCCEAFVLPSHQENFGIAVVEALACHKPVLISDQINIWKEIKNEGGGIVTVDTLEGTRKLLHSWTEMNVHQKTFMELQAYAVYEKHFNVDVVAHRFLKAITS